MHSVGIDLHRKRSHIAALDDAGRAVVARGGSSTTPRRSSTLLEGVGECRVALEATYGWEWLADVLAGRRL